VSDLVSKGGAPGIPPGIPTGDPLAALEFCRRLAEAVGKEESIRWPGPGRAGADAPEVSVVIPMYNEEENVAPLYAALVQALSPNVSSYELVFVNDGCSDATPKLITDLAEQDPHVVMLDLSRNFGHQVAISAGLEYSSGNAVMIMDGDMQDPPEVLPRLIERWREGYEVVYAIRKKRKEGLLKRFAYSTFYRVLRWISHVDIPLDAGDFCLMDRRVVDLLVRMPERNRFLRGLRSWLGFRQTGVTYERDARAGGEPKYTFRRLIFLALDGFLSFSYMPLRLISVVGVGVSFFSIVLALYYLAKKVFFALSPPGFTTLVVAVFFLAGIQLITIGVMGEYVARISDEVKRRPMFIIHRVVKGKRPSGS
jgi:polyisoprenyl-phosphate glycosyltransferase